MTHAHAKISHSRESKLDNMATSERRIPNFYYFTLRIIWGTLPKQREYSRIATRLAFSQPPDSDGSRRSQPLWDLPYSTRDKRQRVQRDFKVVILKACPRQSSSLNRANRPRRPVSKEQLYNISALGGVDFFFNRLILWAHVDVISTA